MAGFREILLSEDREETVVIDGQQVTATIKGWAMIIKAAPTSDINSPYIRLQLDDGRHFKWNGSLVDVENNINTIETDPGEAGFSVNWVAE